MSAALVRPAPLLPRLRRVAFALAPGLLGAVAALYYALTFCEVWLAPTHRSDFIAMRGWALYIHRAADPTMLYDPVQVQAFFHALIANFKDHYPFAYPPSFLLLIGPLAYLSWPVAGTLWRLGQMALYALLPAEPGWRREQALGMLAVPVTALAVSIGQDGLVVAALLGGGCRLLERRPVLAGVLFGLASVKPQFGVLVPLALLAAGQWRALAAAAAAVLGLVLASGAVFGFRLWLAWPEAMAGLSHYVGDTRALDHLVPTVAGNLRLIGAAPWVVWAAQGAAALVAAAVTWHVWRRRGPGQAASAVLLVGAMLVSPYAFYYDLVIMNLGLAAFVLDRRARLAGWEWAVLAAAFLVPPAMNFAFCTWPVSLPIVLGSFFMVARSALRPGLDSGAGGRQVGVLSPL